VLGVDPALVLFGAPPQLVDEWQLDATRVWNHVRAEVDRRQRSGLSILTGSATPPDDARRHSGAGRFARLTMRPMTLFESGDSTGEMSLAGLLDGHRPTAKATDVTVSRYTELVVRTPSFVLDMMMLSGRSASAELWTSLDPATDRYPVFAAHRDELLRLTDPEIFLAALDDEPGHDGLSRYRRLERSRTATIGAMQREISAVAAAGDSARADVRRLTEALADAERSSSLLRSEIESRAAVLHAVRGECEHLRADLDRATTALRVLEGTVFGRARAALLQSRTLTGIWSLYRRARPPRIGR
jgi:hypothetical protein